MIQKTTDEPANPLTLADAQEQIDRCTSRDRVKEMARGEIEPYLRRSQIYI